MSSTHHSALYDHFIPHRMAIDLTQDPAKHSVIETTQDDLDNDSTGVALLSLPMGVDASTRLQGPHLAIFDTHLQSLYPAIFNTSLQALHPNISNTHLQALLPAISSTRLTRPTVHRPATSNARPIFHTVFDRFNEKSPNFDRLGVLYELGGIYLTIWECENDPIRPGLPAVEFKWLHPSITGEYIWSEWAVLSKRMVGKYGKGVAPSNELGFIGAHSKKMMEARLICWEVAEELTQVVYRERVMEGKVVSMRTFQDRLTDKLISVFGAYFDTVIAEEKKEDEAMKEFVNFDLCEG